MGENDTIQLTPQLRIASSELDFHAVRAQGPGGQNVNKVASAVHLRFDVVNSSLPEPVKQRLLARPDRRLNREGVLVIKAQRHRTQEKNRLDAVRRLCEWVAEATAARKSRVATRPTRGSRLRRLDSKTRRGRTKSLRGRVTED